MAGQYFFLVCSPVVHAASLAISVFFACGTCAGFCPFSVAIHFETVVPYINEIVLINVALNKAAVDVWACPDAAVNQDRADVDACPAEEAVVTYLLFIAAHVAFATELYFDPVFCPFCFDEFH